MTKGNGGRPRKARKHLRDIFAALEVAGWVVDTCGSGHYRARSPAGAVIIMSSSPSGHYARASILRDMRRHGVTLP